MPYFGVVIYPDVFPSHVVLRHAYAPVGWNAVWILDVVFCAVEKHAAVVSDIYELFQVERDVERRSVVVLGAELRL